MSEFTNHRETKVNQLVKLFEGILKGESLSQLVGENQKLIGSTVPADVVLLVDRLVQNNVPMPELKKGINKLLNLLYKTLLAYPFSPPDKNSFLGCMAENNHLLDLQLQQIKPLLREFNKNRDKDLQQQLLDRFREVEKVGQYYLIKENVLFPVIEKYIPEFRCLSVMWSFHDDIRRNLKGIISELGKKEPNLVLFNKLVGDVFFNIYAIKFREERILFPVAGSLIEEREFDKLFEETFEQGFPFYQPEQPRTNLSIAETKGDLIDLGTGNLSVGQIKLLFDHLPVDITFVDEHNKVRYFSSPKMRIFPRSKAVIGRDVHNCHPPESVHVVEEIVETFRNGKQDVASFWINMKGQKLLIQYFAIRDEKGNYRGVVEVSQEISKIQNLQGEKRLLDW